MNNKTLLALIAIFVIAGSVTAVFAENVQINTFNFETPKDFKVNSTNDTCIVLHNDHKDILISSDIIGANAINSYLTAKGFKYNETINGTKTVTGSDLSGSYNYTANTFTKDKGFAIAYLLSNKNKNMSVIAIDNDFDANDSFASSDLEDAAMSIVDKIMLAK
ncbi:hypothetical protein [Methanobrevibacter sp.]|uniref:hypothetical protein n=1 Tax=Methanobrevibacter sp. TaxID=66852 RepID=UPI00388D39F5